MSLLNIEDLSLCYPDGRCCLKRLNLRLERGEMVLIAGRSGCGKSSLLSCINGIIPHLIPATLEGKISMDGTDLTTLTPEQRCVRVGSLFQDFESQLIHSRVDDELAFGPANLALERQDILRRVHDVRQLIGLAPEADPGTLSGGNMQRLCLGAALTMGPDLLILDEPFSNIDVGSARNLMAFLKGLCSEGKTVLIAEHRLDLLGSLPDRVLYLQDGALTGNRTFAQIPIPELQSHQTDQEPMVTLSKVSFSYHRNTPVVQEADLQIMAGESVVILGENGCGKSTLLQLMAGLLRPNEGHVVTAGVRTGHSTRKLRGRVGLIWQNPNHQLFMDTVASEVFMNSDDEVLVQKLLKKFGLWEQRNIHPRKLSEGQKRRLAVAAILAGQPRLLLLDEPTLGQDDESLQGMIQALEDYRLENGMTIVSVTHDPRAALALGSKAFVMRSGSLTEVSDRRELTEILFDSR